MLRDETSFCHKLKESHTNAFKYDDTKVETGIWDNAKTRVLGEEFISESQGIIFDYLRKKMTRRLKTNVLSSFIRCMNLTHDLLVVKHSDEI